MPEARMVKLLAFTATIDVGAVQDAEKQFYLLDYQVAQGVEELATVEFTEVVGALDSKARQSNQQALTQQCLCQQVQAFPDHAMTALPIDLQPEVRRLIRDTVRTVLYRLLAETQFDLGVVPCATMNHVMPI